MQSHWHFIVLSQYYLVTVQVHQQNVLLLGDLDLGTLVHLVL